MGKETKDKTVPVQSCVPKLKDAGSLKQEPLKKDGRNLARAKLQDGRK